VAEC